MAEVRPAGTNRIRVFNPINPKRRKPWTQRQAAARKDQAERFVRGVLEDDDRGDEIADISVEEYAEERGKELVRNPTRSKSMKRKPSPEQQQRRENPVAKALETTTRWAEEQSDLHRRIRELEEEKESLGRLELRGEVWRRLAEACLCNHRSRLPTVRSQSVRVLREPQRLQSRGISFAMFSFSVGFGFQKWSQFMQ
jgi:hypothetical protein